MKFPYALNTVVCGDALELLKRLPDECVDAVVTDPPYGLKFMGKHWDCSVPDAALWMEVLRVMKPGAHLTAFFGTRTYHRGVVAIEDAGFEIRDQLAWVYGQGFPKSLDVSKAIDKAAGALRLKVRIDGQRVRNPKCVNGGRDGASGATRPWIEKAMRVGYHEKDGNDPCTAAAAWNGWGTALKPAWEPIVLARKPLIGTVAENVLANGTGAINVDGCRVNTSDKLGGGVVTGSVKFSNDGWNRPWMNDQEAVAARSERARNAVAHAEQLGRWPANLVHDGSEEVMACFPDAPGAQFGVGPKYGEKPSVNDYGDYGLRQTMNPRGDAGSAARFFYCAKADAEDRTAGNNHPTVKPLALMRWLVTLVTPPGGLVLDPFAGSGSTGVAAIQLGFRFLGFDLDEHNCRDIAAPRLQAATRGQTVEQFKSGQLTLDDIGSLVD